MKKNGSYDGLPFAKKLKYAIDPLFEPSNDIDDYTQVTMFINREFVALKAAENRASEVESQQNDRGNDAAGSLGENEHAAETAPGNPALKTPAYTRSSARAKA